MTEPPPQRSDKGADQRRAKRSRVLKAGSIEFSGGAIDCIVRNISNVGAALDVESVVGIPAVFNLFIRDADRQWACTIVWRSGKRIGVEFKADA